MAGRFTGLFASPDMTHRPTEVIPSFRPSFREPASHNRGFVAWHEREAPVEAILPTSITIVSDVSDLGHVTNVARSVHPWLEYLGPIVISLAFELGCAARVTTDVDHRHSIAPAYAFAPMVSVVDERSASIQAFLHRVYQQVEADEPERALDLIFDEIDELYERNDLQQIDRLLATVELSRMDTPSMLGFLSTTLIRCESLPSRARYLERVRDILSHNHSSEQVEALLGGLG